MAKNVHIPPRASSLLHSLRDLGYSVEAAIADLIDNSISANATKIDVVFKDVEGEPTLTIMDNGFGMDEVELISAMRHGSKDPRLERNSKDLGRFGLGLKTASFSQCRRLTVISRKGEVLCGADWDLRQLDDTDDWYVSVLDETDLAVNPFVSTLFQSGTIVIWRDLDRFLEGFEGDRRQELVSEKLHLVSRHLALVFHRFLSDEYKAQKKIQITINGDPISGFDPFCKKNPATQMLPEEVLVINGAEVRLIPYVLPHHSNLSASDYDYYQERSDFISNQGCYVYRNGRLMAWGDWFRLVPKGESTKLARVQIDFPNSLDEAWTIDIKKSRARPPEAVRNRLRQIISQITDRSVTISRERGRRLVQEEKAPFWERYMEYGGIRYVINTDHPLVDALNRNLSTEEMGLLRTLLDSVASSLPIEMIYSDYSTNPIQVKQSIEISDEDSLPILRDLWNGIYGSDEGDINNFIEIIRSTKLFDRSFGRIEKIVKENFK